jgi:hypothetical protein
MSGRERQFNFVGAVRRVNVNNALKLRISLVMAVAGFAALGFAVLGVSGCKSAPDLTAADAQKLIQAKYDADPPAGATIKLTDLGMRQGVTAKYWDRSKSFPIKWWADFKLSDTGKKTVKLANGGDTIEWRPDSADDKNYGVTVSTIATNHLKAKDAQDPQNDSDGTKTVAFNESVSLDGVPAPLQDIAHNPGNRLSTKRTATFTLDNGVWKLQSIT